MAEERMIVALAGKKRSGKGSLAGFFVYEGFKEIAFADALWEVLIAADPYVDIQVGWRLSHVLRFHTQDEAKVAFPEIRRLLQHLGSNGIREVIGMDTWLNIVRDKVLAEPEQSFVVSDLRFVNESDMIHDLGGAVIKLEREGDKTFGSEHYSENEIDLIRQDWLYENNGSFTDMENFVFDLLNGKAA